MQRRLPERIKGVSLDFANTLYPLNRAGTIEVVGHLHRFLEERLQTSLPSSTLAELYFAIRDRQFAENRATLCDNDFPARLREMISHVHEPPDDALIQDASDAYAKGFIDTMRLASGVLDTIQALFERFRGRVVVCSNFIRRDCIVEPLRRDGILPLLRSVVVSCDIGFVKPHPLVFQAVCKSLELDTHEVAHVGDDLDADISGAKAVGMTTVYTTQMCLPAPDELIEHASPDFKIARLNDLISLL